MRACIEWFNELLEEVKKERNSLAGKRTDELYQLDRKGITDAKESSRKRRKVALDSKVRVVNELVDEGKSESDEHSE
jgi:vacuolar-type H+-ATPase subunit H